MRGHTESRVRSRGCWLSRLYFLCWGALGRSPTGMRCDLGSGCCGEGRSEGCVLVRVLGETVEGGGVWGEGAGVAGKGRMSA